MSERTLGGSGSREHRDWQVLGARDPLWAVLMKPGTKNGGWDVEAFLATGQAEVEAALGHLAELGCTPEPGTAVDFGCGAGRTAIALLDHFDRVIGIDVSGGMLATARELAPRGAPLQLVLAENGAGLADLPDGSVDLVFSSLVVQHMPAAEGLAALAEVARVVRPGGAVVVQVATEPLTNVKGLLFKYCPWPLLRLGQRFILRYPAPMRMQAVSAHQVAQAFGQHGVEVRDRVEDLTYGGHWTYHRYFGVKQALLPPRDHRGSGG